MLNINILHLTQRRKHFVKLSHFLLSKCKFKDFNITICGVEGSDAEEIYNIAEESKKLGLNVSVLIVDNSSKNYLDKIIKASELNYEYTIKMDEDIFLGPNAWDYLFNNINILDNDENILIAPTLSTGIPTCDDFIKYNLSDIEKEKITFLFNNSHIPDAWGCYYDTIREYLKNNKYLTKTFYETVGNINHSYKGVHPIRFDLDSIKYLNSLIENKIDLFLEDRTFFFKTITEPYLCNNFFVIKTKLWNEILNDKSLFFDAFDEVTLNNYRYKTNKNFLTIPNIFGIHTLYNTLHCEMGLSLTEMNNIENEFVNNINKSIINLIKNYE